jgi:hypothetical protein
VKKCPIDGKNCLREVCKAGIGDGLPYCFAEDLANEAARGKSVGSVITDAFRGPHAINRQIAALEKRVEELERENERRRDYERERAERG